MVTADFVYSVSQLNREAKRLLASHFINLCVEGEISNFMMPSSGHWYFTLKDSQAQVRCAMFRGQQQRLGFKPSDGDMVIVNAQVSLYEPRGDYQLVIEHMEQAGEGALRQAFERLKLKLLNDGVFDESRKQLLPLIPRQIGVITSPSGAAIRDILSVLQRRFPAVPILIYPIAVQGDAAKLEISQALCLANQRREVDVLILARGGGSLEDLWAFNEEIVARAIAASKIPVISGVGHEVDVTIADFAADLRAPTPSVAAEHAVPNAQDWLNAFRHLEDQLLMCLRRHVAQYRQRLDWLAKSLHLQHPGQKLQRNAQRVDELEQRLIQVMQFRLSHERQRFEFKHHQLMKYPPLLYILAQRKHLMLQRQRLQRAMQQQLAVLSRHHASLMQTLHAVSPLATLQRGYAIVQYHDDTDVIKSVDDVNVGEVIDVRLAKGSLQAKIIAVFNVAGDCAMSSHAPLHRQ